MHHYYSSQDGERKQYNREGFIQYLQTRIADEFGQEPPRTWADSALAVAEAGVDAKVSDSDKKAMDFVRSIMKESRKLADQVEKEKQQTLNKQEIEEERHLMNQAEVEQAAWERAEETRLKLREASSTTIRQHLGTYVSTNFEVTPNGGLIPKKNAPLSLEDSFVAIASVAQLAANGEEMASKSGMALGDILVAVEDKHGENIISQVISETGKSQSFIRSCTMISRQFGGRDRQELDPQGNLQFGHWQEITGRKYLSADQKRKVAQFAAERKVSAKKIRSLIETLKAVKEGERDEVLEAISANAPNTDTAVEIIKTKLELDGTPQPEKVRFLYITADKPVNIQFITSNDYNPDLAYDAQHVIKLCPVPKIYEGPDTLTDIEFVRTKPEVLEDDPSAPNKEPAVYGDFRVFFDDEAQEWAATGTIAGKAESLSLDGAGSSSEAVEMVMERFEINADMRDAEGRLWNLRS